MRITNNMILSNMMLNLNNNLNRMNKVNQQLSTGKKFQLPSDDPIGVSKSLNLNTDLSKIEQYKRNLDDAVSWMEITEDTIGNMGEVIQRARELTVDAANGTKSVEDSQAISKEIEQLREQLIQFANTTYAGRSIFTGYKTDAPLLDEDGNYMLTKLKEGAIDPADTSKKTINLKLDEVSKYNVGVSEDVMVNTVGSRLFGMFDGSLDNYNFDGTISGYEVGDDGAGNKVASSTGAEKSYMIELFDSLKTAMDTGDSGAISGYLDKIDDVHENLLSIRAEIGAKTNRLELTQNRLGAEKINFTRLLSNNEDADMAEVIMNLNISENVYRASLSAGAKIIQPTLIDFLR